VDPEVMNRPPRKKSENIISQPLLARVLSSALVILIGTSYVFITELQDGAPSERDTTMTFTTFVFFDLFNALSCRHNSRPCYELKWNSNPAFLVAIAFSLFGQYLVIYFPPFQRVFRTVPLEMGDLVYIFCLASTIFFFDVIRKLCFPRWFVEQEAKRAGEEEDEKSSMARKQMKLGEEFIV
jgi:P-type Ca2+ transporter type 2C